MKELDPGCTKYSSCRQWHFLKPHLKWDHNTAILFQTGLLITVSRLPSIFETSDIFYCFMSYCFISVPIFSLDYIDSTYSLMTRQTLARLKKHTMLPLAQLGSQAIPRDCVAKNKTRSCVAKQDRRHQPWHTVPFLCSTSLESPSSPQKPLCSKFKNKTKQKSCGKNIKEPFHRGFHLLDGSPENAVTSQSSGNQSKQIKQAGHFLY